MYLINTKEAYIKGYSQIKTLEERFSVLKSNVQINNDADVALDSEIYQIKKDMYVTLQEISKSRQRVA